MWQLMKPIVAGEIVPDDLRERLRAIALEQPAEGLVRAVQAIRDRPDSTAVVAQLEVPFLVAVGDHDSINSVDYARQLATVAPRGEALVFEQTGHLPSFERPAELNAKLLRFLGG